LIFKYVLMILLAKSDLFITKSFSYYINDKKVGYITNFVNLFG
jgi:hypothetical protein